MKHRLIGIVLGMLTGLILGAGTGIVGAFGGIGGIFVFGILGAVIGFFATPDVKRFFQRWLLKNDR